MKTRILIVLAAIVLSSCATMDTTTGSYTPVATPKISSTPVLSLTSTPIPVTKTLTQPTLLPTQKTLTAIAIAQTQEWTFPAITPEPAELEQWREYERSLGNAIYEMIPTEDIICEWQIVGRAEGEVYVWAACSGFRSLDSELTTYTQCTVVYLGSKGEVQRVGTIDNTSGASYGEVRRKLFPPGIYERCVHTSSDKMWEHLESRRENPEPPLIVLNATPTP